MTVEQTPSFEAPNPPPHRDCPQAWQGAAASGRTDTADPQGERPSLDGAVPLTSWPRIFPGL